MNGVLLWCVLVSSTQAAPVSHTPQQTVRQVRARQLPSDLQARFQLDLTSDPMGWGGTASGGVLVSRPGRARIEVFGPMGGSLASLLADGESVAVLLARERRHILAADAEVVLRQATGGVAGTDDLLATLVGDLPFRHAPTRSIELRDRLVYLELDGPNGVRVEAILDPKRGLPVSYAARDSKGSLLLRATYEGWSTYNQHDVPMAVQLEVPAIDLLVNVRYQPWSRPTPTRFETAAPNGFATEPMEQLIQRSIKSTRQP